MLLAAREASAPLATKGVPTARRHYFGRVEPCLRDDHAFRFDLRFGSFNDWSRLGLASNLSKALFFIFPILDNPMRTQSF